LNLNRTSYFNFLFGLILDNLWSFEVDVYNR
jgi:hypothetical protein